MQTPISGELVKNAGAISWSEVDGREAALIERCTAGDEAACGELVEAHQRMVYSLALHLLGDRDEALDLSQEVFLRVFRTLASFRGQSALRTWIYRIVVNQARNRQRWWRRRHRAHQVSLDEHIRDHGEFPESGHNGSPDRALGQKLLAERIRVALEGLPFDQRTAVGRPRPRLARGLREALGVEHQPPLPELDALRCAAGVVGGPALTLRGETRRSASLRLRGETAVARGPDDREQPLPRQR